MVSFCGDDDVITVMVDGVGVYSGKSMFKGLINTSWNPRPGRRGRGNLPVLDDAVNLTWECRKRVRRNIFLALCIFKS